MSTQIKPASKMDFPLQSLSSEDNTIYTPMPIISRDTSEMKNINHKTAKNILLQAIFRQKAQLRVRIRHQMQRKILRLWNVCTKHQDSEALHSKEMKNLELWKHIQGCCDIDCKENFCQSSRRIIISLSNCHKTLNQHPSSTLCAPVMNDYRLKKKHDSEIYTGWTKGIDGTMIYGFDENKGSTSYKLEQISKIAQNSHTTAACVERNIFPHDQHHTFTHCQKKLEGGQDGSSVKRPLFLQQLQPVEHTQICTEDKAVYIKSSNPNISSEKLHVEIPISGKSITFEPKSLSEEEDRSDALIALLSLKKIT